MLRNPLIAILTLFGATACDDGTVPNLLGADTYFVKLNTNAAAVASTTQAIAGTFGLEVIHTYDAVTEGFSAKLPALLISEVESFNAVEYVRIDEGDHGVPDEEDPLDDPIEDPSVVIGDDEIPESLLRIGAPFTGAGLDQIHVAVIDTGIDRNHPDLNVVGEIDLVPLSGSGAAAPGADPNGHGTHCAGTIAAIADGEGVVGVAPGVALHAVRVLNEDGSGFWTDIVAGLEYVLDHPEIRVVNMSLGGPASNDPNDPMRQAIQRLQDNGVVVVIAAGNEDQNTNNVSPANFDLGVVVSAYDAAGGSDNGFASFSNFGPQVDIAAPGVDIMSTFPGNRYVELSGTSMATPAVAGAIAAYLASNPDATPADIRDRLIATGEDGYAGQGGDHPEPLVDVGALLE
ncbi:MAG: S8 family peptidase [Myxococcota bacterium]